MNGVLFFFLGHDACPTQVYEMNTWWAEVVAPEFAPPAFILMNHESPHINVQTEIITCRV